MCLGPSVQKYFVVNDQIFHYEIKNDQIQPKAYLMFMKSLERVRKTPFEKFDKTARAGTAYTIEISPEAE